ncbi:hypothetical protein NM688_g3256 [Phlebia brevispora]|uniref:Uncharacterized protein n=1 Tax=Phlebia brevispora TaxID=194682 RepID=A0ACC1T6G0_9APHY|nr:hypothetical protein NM688_g3256 [Phlebia brevispora]
MLIAIIALCMPAMRKRTPADGLHRDDDSDNTSVFQIHIPLARSHLWLSEALESCMYILQRLSKESEWKPWFKIRGFLCLSNQSYLAQNFLISSSTAPLLLFNLDANRWGTARFVPGRPFRRSQDVVELRLLRPIANVLHYPNDRQPQHLRRVGEFCFVPYFASLLLALPQDQGNGNKVKTSLSSHKTSTTATPTSTQSTSSAPSASPSASGSFTGDAVCLTAMCIGALVNGSNVQYTLQSSNTAQLGWMAMGFGSTMANSDMVIMWSNSDGSITLSQRTAPGEVMPTLDSSPPFTASIVSSMSSTNSSNPKFTYAVPLNSTGTQSIIWAYGTTNPGSSSTSASIVQHIAAGTSKLALGNTLTSSSRDPTNPVSIGFSSTGQSGNSTTGNNDPSTGATSIPLENYEKLLIAHGILTAVGFLVLLPFGALLARYIRVFTPLWFTGHWIFQFALGLPVIVAGVALGIAGVSQSGSPHLDDTHMKWGVAIFVLYFAQLLLGALVHWVKPKVAKPGFRRPIHNYLHAIFGLFIIAVSFYQVRTGFREEWPESTGRGDVSNAANIIWYIWVVLMPVLYFAGLVFLRRQFRQEKVQRETLMSSSDAVGLTASPDMRPSPLARYGRDKRSI